MRDAKSTVLYQWFQEVWNKDNETAIEMLMARDGLAHGIIADGQPNGAEGFKLFFRDFRKQFHHIQIDVEEVIAQDDLESALTTVHATHSETGRQVSFSGICMARIKEGRIAEAWNHYDFLSMYRQLGHKLVAAPEMAGNP